MIKEFAV